MAFALALPCHIGHASGVVNHCTDADLRAALAGGGVVTFACDGTIALTNTLTISASTTLDGSGRQVVLSGGGAVRPFLVRPGVQFTLQNVTVANGFAPSHGGGLWNDGITRLIDCTFSNHLAISSPCFGGAIFHAGGSLQVSGCAFLFNRAVGTNGFVSLGGAIGGGYLNPAGALNVTNSTFHGNSASSGGAIHINCGSPYANGPAVLSHCTFAGNTNGAVIFCQPLPATNPRMTLLSCLLSANQGPNCSGITDGGHNLSSESSGGFTHPFSMENVDPHLGPLAANGGPTLTLAPLPDSPAIDAGPSTGCAGADQRGTARPFGPACDIGAVEATFSGTHAGLLQFLRPGETLTESNGVVPITVVRAGGGSGNVTVDFNTGDLVAAAGYDFVATNGTLSFLPWQRSNTFQIRLLEDTEAEGAEVFRLLLSNPGAGAVLGRAIETVTILDNDAAVAFSAPAVAVSERGSTLTTTLQRSGSTSGVVTVNWTTVAGAAGTADYTPVSGVAQFAPGQTLVTISVPIRDDNLAEADETFQIHLSNPSAGVVLGSPQVQTVTVYDDDGVRVVSECSEAALRFALGIGGRVHLDCDGTIVLADTIFVTQSGSLDAVGHQVTLSGNQSVQMLRIQPGVQFGLRELTLAHGFSAIQGGGIHNQGELEIRDCTFASNTVASVTQPNGTGGAIHNLGTLRIAGSTFRDNRASYTGGAIAAGYSFAPVPGRMFLTNCTFKGNRSTNGAALAAGGSNLSEVVNCTLADSFGQAVNGLATLRNSILAGSSSANCGAGVADGGHNLSSDGSCGFTHPASRNNIDPRLDAFGAHGGPTWTYSLLDASPATDAANLVTSPATDQRGTARPYGIGPDIGALETTLIPGIPGAFRLGASSVQQVEGASAITFTVHRVEGAFGAASVQFATSDSSATAGADYFSTNGTLIFAPGQILNSFQVRLRDDALQESDETFSVTLSMPGGGATLGSPTTATVTLIDDESPAVVTACDDASLRAAIAARPVVRVACDGVIVLTNPLVINASTWIDASDRAVTLSGSNATRIFLVTPGAFLCLRHLTLADGRAVGTNGATGQQGGPGVGGALCNDGGTLVANDCIFARNTAVGGLGGMGIGVFPTTTTPGGGGLGAGGAIYSAGGHNFLTNVVFEWNRAVGGRGGDIANTSQGGISGPAQGGAIHASGGTLSVEEATFADNGVAFGNPGRGMRLGQTGDVSGGALSGTDAVVTMVGSFFERNASGLGVNTPATVQGGGARGGAVRLQGGTLAATTTTFLNNAARGGPTYQISFATFPGGPAEGGALFLETAGTITECALAGNVAQGGPLGGGLGPTSGSGRGGGIFNRATLTLRNTTLAGNAALGGEPAHVSGDGLGGGIFNDAGQITLQHVTVASNSARRSTSLLSAQTGVSLGGGLFSTNGSVALRNSIVAHSLSGSNGFGSFWDEGQNLSSDRSLLLSAPGSLNNTDPVLGPLADYGGPTPSMALLAGSPAFDAAGSGNCPDTDQRGIPRPFGAGCDIGAFESAPPYTILGQVQGFTTPASGIQITSPAASTGVPPDGAFALHGLAAGTHVLSIASPECVFVPRTRSVTVGLDVVDVTFQSYRTNALVLGLVPGPVARGVFAGEASQPYRVLASGDLSLWTPWSTNTTDADGVFEFLDPAAPSQPRRFFQVVRP